MSVEVMLLILLGLVAAMAVTFGQLRASLDRPSCPECPHCRELERQDQAREQADRLRLEERLTDYRDVDHRDGPGPGR